MAALVVSILLVSDGLRGGESKLAISVQSNPYTNYCFKIYLSYSFPFNADFRNSWTL